MQPYAPHPVKIPEFVLHQIRVPVQQGSWDYDVKHVSLPKFSVRLIGSAMFGATFNLVTRVGSAVIFGTMKDDSL